MNRTGKVSVLMEETDNTQIRKQARKYQLSAAWKIKPEEKHLLLWLKLCIPLLRKMQTFKTRPPLWAGAPPASGPGGERRRPRGPLAPEREAGASPPGLAVLQIQKGLGGLKTLAKGGHQVGKRAGS